METVRKFKESLRCRLTTEEVAARADQAAGIVAEKHDREESRKRFMSQEREAVKQLDADLRTLSTEVREQAAYRLVECEEQQDFPQNRAVTLRMDTMETVRERPMTPDERQVSLFKPRPVSSPLTDKEQLALDVEAAGFGDAEDDDEGPESSFVGGGV
jgi:hypothetical protein